MIWIAYGHTSPESQDILGVYKTRQEAKKRAREMKWEYEVTGIEHWRIGAQIPENSIDLYQGGAVMV